MINRYENLEMKWFYFFIFSDVGPIEIMFVNLVLWLVLMCPYLIGAEWRVYASVN